MPDQHVAIRNIEALRLHESAVRLKVRKERIQNNRASGLKTAAIVGLVGLVGWTVTTNNKLAQKVADRVVTYAVLQANGEFITSTHYNEVVPVGDQTMQVSNALWTYVQARDCYSISDFTRQAYIAQAMSNERITNMLHKEYALANPNAPQHVYGDHGITVHCTPVDPPQAIGDQGDLMFFRFRRYEDDGRPHPEQAALAPIYTVTVRYRTGVYPHDDKLRAWVDPTTINAPGVQVLDYPGAQPTNAAPVVHPHPEMHS